MKISMSEVALIAVAAAVWCMFLFGLNVAG